MKTIKARMVRNRNRIVTEQINRPMDLCEEIVKMVEEES